MAGMGSDLRPVRGTKDILPEEHAAFDRVVAAARKVGAAYGCQSLSTPIIEYTDVFKRTLGDASDIVNKEMYTFEDRGGDSVTLRPEFTAGVARAFLSNGLQQRLPLKLFSWGPLFRYERPQKGRQRQFHQINMESLGDARPEADVEILSLATRFLEELGLGERVTLELNSLGDNESRSAYRAALVDYFAKYEGDLSTDSKQRLQKNPLRILDSKDSGDQKIAQDAPVLSEYYSKEAAAFFATVREGLEEMGLSYTLNARLVRGLDYYCHTAFEFTTTELGAQNAVLGGGRYDGLIKLMGGPATPAVGFAAGMERLALLAGPPSKPVGPAVLIPMGASAAKRALALAHTLRGAGLYVETLFGSNVGKRLTRANKMSARSAVVFGDDELAKGRVKVKDLASGQETEHALEDLGSALKP
jgi:histidyl-tRNA synthetase